MPFVTFREMAYYWGVSLDVLKRIYKEKGIPYKVKLISHGKWYAYKIEVSEEEYKEIKKVAKRGERRRKLIQKANKEIKEKGSSDLNLKVIEEILNKEFPNDE